MYQRDTPTGLTKSQAGLYSINLARYAAALYLALFHLLPVESMTDGLWKNFFSKGYFGTSFFFILSGFILTYIYTDKVNLNSNRYEFYIKRLVRLYPPYLLSAVISIPILTMSKHPLEFADLSRQIMVYLAGLQTWIWNWNFAINIPGWSVSALLFFYFIFPFANQILRQLGKWLPITLLSLWIIYLCEPTIYMYFAPDNTSVSVFQNYPWLNFLKFNPLLRLPDFLLGMGAALLLRQGQVPQWLNHYLTLPMLLLLLIGLAIGIPANTTLYPLLHNGLMTPLLIMIVLALSSDRSGFARLGAHPLSRKLADSSLQIFLLHLPFSAYVYKAAEFLGRSDREHSIPMAISILLILIPLTYVLDQRLMRPITMNIINFWQNHQQHRIQIKASAQPEYAPNRAGGD